MVKNTAEVVYQSKARFKSLTSNVWAHDLTERLKIRRRRLAKECGLGDIDVGTYPSHPATIVNNTSPLVPIILSALLGGGGFLGGMALSSQSGAGDLTGLSPRNQSAPIEFDIEILGTEDGIEANVLPPEN